ncbi:MAG: DUF134 domain-containing protein [Methanomicrobiales archaeon]|nr:DUF134 domain-containing protein [Methanomicrobiales archaeon]
MSGNEGGCCRRRGRPRLNRTFDGAPSARCFAPRCGPDINEEYVSLLPEELAVLDLIDLQGLEQEMAAAALGISRKTVWRDIHEAHRKIADALVHGKALEIGGCLRRKNGICPLRNTGVCPKVSGIKGTTLTLGTDDPSLSNPGGE